MNMSNNTTIEEISVTTLDLISTLDLIVISIGTIGNLTSFYLLRKIKTLSSINYILALCLVDTICLYGWYLSSVYRQLFSNGLKRLENTSWLLCKLISFGSLTSLQLSSIFLCYLTIDRFLLLFSIKWRKSYSKSKKFNRSLIIATVVCIFALNIIIPVRLGNGNNFVTLNDYDFQQIPEPNGQSLNATNESRFLLCYDQNDRIFRAWSILHLCVYSLIPFPVLVVFNIIVIKMVKKTLKGQLNMPKRLKTGKIFVSRLLTLVTISFLLTTLPSTLVYAFWRNQVLTYKHGRVILNLLNTLQFSRHSLSWIIYILSSSKMRNAFRKCLKCDESSLVTTYQNHKQQHALISQKDVIMKELKKYNVNPVYHDFYVKYFYNANEEKLVEG
jgi:hypothetical protein